MVGRALVVLVFLSANVLARPGVFVPRQENGKVVTHPREANPKPEALRSMTSHKNLLGLERETPFGLPKSKGGLPLALSAQADTVRILVLRVEFQTEDPDDTTTTGNGNFDLRTLGEFFAAEGHKLDPAPHNAAFFSAHMRALDRYWAAISDGGLRLSWDIFPQQEDAAFRLPHPMAYYGSAGPWADSGVVAQLQNFFKEAIMFADTMAPEINFAQYDALIIFHAGSDQQNNLWFVEDTPNDFWTGFLWTSDTTIVVDSGTVRVNEGTIVPETASQDNRVTVLNAVLAHEFGHQLGLVDLYNTFNFLTTLGDFSLMDNNGMSIVVELGEYGVYSALVSGIIPVFPDAWSRAYLGFSGVTEIANGANITVQAAEQQHHSGEVIKVPITDMEYFLIENRRPQADFRYLQFSTNDTLYIRADPETGVILGPEYGYYLGDSLYTFPSFDYDYLTPGDGLLIWHVDEAVAYMNYTGGGPNFLMNTLQWDPRRRFVSVVEADGIIDFGGDYVSWGYYGSDAEYFKQGNNTDLTPSTRPDTRSNLGGDTHIAITDISESDTLMSCNVATGWYQPGFPVMAFPDLNDGDAGILAADVDNDSVTTEIIVGRSKFLMGIGPDGSSIIGHNIGLALPGFDGSSIIYDWPRFAVLDTAVVGNIIAGDFDSDGVHEVACFDVANKLYIFKAQDVAPQDSLADLFASTVLPAGVTAGPVAYDFDEDAAQDIVAGFADNTIRLIHVIADSLIARTLTTLAGPPMAIAISDIKVFAVIGDADGLSLFVGTQDSSAYSVNEDGIVDLPIGGFVGLACGDVTRDGFDDAAITVGDFLCLYDGESATLKVVGIESPSPPALGDVDADGFPDIVVAGGEGHVRIFAYNYKGNLMDGFPARVAERYSSSEKLRQPTLADVDGDHDPDIVVALPKRGAATIFDFNQQEEIIISVPAGGVDCVNKHGDRLGGFPIVTSSEANTEPALADLDGDGDVDIAVLDSAGFLSVWDLDGARVPTDQPWAQAAGDFSRRGFLSPDFLKPVAPLAGFLPAGSVYNYPNPASNSTTFRYYVDRPANISIRIYDMSGELVAELAGETEGGTVADELVWDCSRVAPGVYFARVEALAGDITRNILVKVALIK